MQILATTQFRIHLAGGALTACQMRRSWRRTQVIRKETFEFEPGNRAVAMHELADWIGEASSRRSIVWIIGSAEAKYFVLPWAPPLLDHGVRDAHARALFEQLYQRDASTAAFGFGNASHGSSQLVSWVSAQLPVELAAHARQTGCELVNNYPQSWQMRYQEAGYMGVDPSVRHGMLSRLPLVWTDDVFSSARELWEEARHAGLRVGWAQSSLDSSGVGGMLTLSRPSDPLTLTELESKEMEMRWLVQAAHLSLSRVMQPKFTVQPDVPLTPREIEVLKWSADGKTASEIADILSIAIPTVNFHIKNVVLKMKAANKTAAVVRALMSGLLN